MNRERIAWLLSIVLLTVTAFRLSPSLAHRDDEYNFVRTLVDVHRQVSVNYVEAVDEEKLEVAAIDGMLGQLDPFTMYIPPAKKEEFDRTMEGTFRGVGIQLNQLDNGDWEVVTPIDGSPALRAGVLAGDVIMKVNGQAIHGIPLKDVVAKIGGETGSDVTLSVRHVTGDSADLKMKRGDITVPTIRGYNRSADNNWKWFLNGSKIAYVRITQFTPSTYDALKPVLDRLDADGMEGLILDLRFNPGGQLDQALKILDLFIEKGTLLSVKGRNRPERIEKASGNAPFARGFPMVVLVNEHSASASEIVAGSLKDNGRAAIIGARTFGKGSVQEVINLDQNAGELKLTVAYYYLPSGRLVHKKKDAKDWGVEPNRTVAMDDAAQKKLLQSMAENEAFHRPATTSSATNNSPPAVGMIDPQLEAAISALQLKDVLSAYTTSRPAATTPSTRAATVPATQDVEP